ncbi:MAG: SufE family protein [Rhodothermales bacterium]
MTETQRREHDIIEEFDLFDDWMGRYEHLIDQAAKLPAIDPVYKTDAYKIKGCQSQVWLHAERQDGRVIFTADSDAAITKGLIALLIRVLSGLSPDEILAADLAFLDAIEMKEHLSPTRKNGLNAMIKQMKLYAAALSGAAPTSS